MVLIQLLGEGMCDVGKVAPLGHGPKILHRLLQRALVALEPQHLVPAQGLTIWAAMAVWQPIASVVTRQPRSSSNSKSLGIAVISLDLASVASWPSTRRLALAQALTLCKGPRPRLRSREPRAVLPSTATTSPSVTCATVRVQLQKHA